MASVPLELKVPEAGAGSDSKPRELTAAQLATLLSVPDLVRVSAVPGGLWQVRGRRRVGVVELGTDEGAVVLHLRPKLAISNLLFLLGHLARDPWRETDATMGVQDGLVPAIAALFTRLAARALDAGVLHGYRETADDLHSVRGRFDVPAQMRRAGLPLPVSVVYDEFTPDIAENRVLAAALTRLAKLPGLSPRTGAALRHLLGRFVEVRIPPPGSPLPAWEPNRLNERYLPALRMAELILADAVPDIRSGASMVGRGIVLNMESIFERFLDASLVAAGSQYGLRCAGQERHHRLDVDRRVKIRPDLTVYLAGGLHCVVDAKYKSAEDGNGSQEDLYQVVAYCTALGLDAGHLVYADGPTKPVVHRVGGNNLTVTVHGLDLSGEPSHIIESIDTLARLMADA